MQAFAAQTPEFHKLIWDAVQKAGRLPAPEIGCGSVTENAARIRLQPSGTQS
jgi:hypothetical protein